MGGVISWISAQFICQDKYKGHLATFDHEAEWDGVAAWLESVASIVQTSFDEMQHVMIGYRDFECTPSKTLKLINVRWKYGGKRPKNP